MERLFVIPYRDRSYKKYNIEVCADERPGFDGKLFHVNILQLTGEIVTSFRIEFARSWLLGRLILTSENDSPLLRKVILDFLFGKRIDAIPDDEVLSFHSQSKYASSVFENQGNGILNFRRDPAIVASENKFIRELMLRELYVAQTEGGNQNIRKFKHRCHFNGVALGNAEKVLIDQNVVERPNEKVIRLKSSGFFFVENNFLLSPYRNTIFLIAACHEDICRLIDLVYSSVVRDQLGYELKFQEKSEPKGAIHDDIWESIE